MLLIASYPGSLPTDSLGLMPHALTPVHYNLPSLSSNWYQALIPSNTSRSIKIPPGIRSHLLQLLPVIMDKSNILWFLEICTHVYQFHPVLTWVICTHLNGEHLLEYLACHACREKPVCISVINCFLHPIKVTINRAGGCWHGKFIALISPKP